MATFTVTNTNDAGAGSLRQAILDANGNPGLNTIAFAIGSGVQTIAPASALPTVTNPVVIDGTAQPGYAGQPLIELNGIGAGTYANGLRISAGNSIVKGLVINRFGSDGILLDTNGNDVVQGNYLGTNVTGTAGLGNGLGMEANSGANLIGGTLAGEGNVISGNRVDGMRLEAGGMGNVVQGNFIGTDAAGTVSLAAANSNNGVVVLGATNTAVVGNVIAASAKEGVEVKDDGTTGTLIQGNLIGTDTTATGALPNTRDGVHVITSSGTTITGNVIANSGNNGVLVETGIGNAIQGNAILA